MKRINKLLPTAMLALKDSGLILLDGKSILKEYDGYVASFAPSVITAGLKATLSFYTDRHKFKEKESDMPDYSKKHGHPTRRAHILSILYEIYQSVDGKLEGGNLLEIALVTKPDQERQLKKDLVNCAIALKLVMRNFKQVESVPKPKSDNQNETAL